MDIHNHTHALGASASRLLRTAGAGSSAHANALLARVSKVVQYPPSRIGRTSALLTMPISIVCRLLEHCDLLDRVAVARTCQTLRLASLSLPHIWSRLDHNEDYVLHNKSRLLQWSYPRLVDVQLSFDTPFPYDAFDAFAAAIFPRLSSFVLRIAVTSNLSTIPDRGQHSVWDRVSIALSRPAPHMHTLSLTFHADPSIGHFHLRSDLLNGEPGVLRTCMLHGLRPPPLLRPCNALSGLHTLDFTHELSSFTASELAAVLSLSPALETFGLTATSFLHDADSDILPSALHSQLRRLAVDFPTLMAFDSARALARRFPTLQELAIVGSAGYNRPFEDQLDWPGPMRAFVLRDDALFEFGDANLQSFCAKVRTNFDVGWGPIMSSHRLMSLVLHEHEVSRCGPLPCAPNLTDLSIFLASWTETADRWDCGVLANTELVFDYPALCSLRFAQLPKIKSLSVLLTASGDWEYRYIRDADYTIALTDIVDFVRDRVRLQPPGRRLDTLILSGIRDIVDFDLAQSLHMIKSIATDIDFEHSLPPHLLRYLSSRDADQNSTSIFSSAQRPDS
ncbi:hypothetical protein EXIGLDRAFT_831432 [Exidia glandulosa HHB12029]|uniref:F-box domain-containing protein n=1 Tax=Exidia glandulosa HHB12029 TaxID=1314781 RepID=A0A165MML6_EXIGL|nr:hypothetical protein EXIGLDRAFT_831432 [Exidia glandulosa HHB12029]